MRGGFVGSICFLTFLLSSGIKGENEEGSPDLNDDSETRNSAVAYANAEDNLKDANTSLRRSYIPPLPSSSSASANAQASSVADGNGPGIPLYGYPSHTSSSAVANALANANSEALPNPGYVTVTPTYGFPSAGLISPYNSGWRSDDHSADNERTDLDAQAAASDEHLEYRHHDPSYLVSESKTKFGNAKSLEDNSNEQESESNRFSFGGYPLLAGAISRAISQSEYIIPDAIPGGQNLINCQKESQIFSLRTADYQCLICVCTREEWFLLRPVCVSCSSCMVPDPIPAPDIVPDIIPDIPPPPQPLVPDSEVSCAPLPEDVPFPNPLNPCQICICERTFNVFGQLDIQIQCKENPECSYIDDVPVPLPQPPVPDVLPPIPYPEPEILPPAPYPLPDIIPEPIPTPDILPPVPNIEPLPLPPSPLPPVDIEPIPWPPIVPLRPTRPRSPLPGPPPHETCNPYPSDIPFQHPWDECQTCVCSEIRGLNVINIEVNCYTKSECCAESPIPDPNALPAQYDYDICEYQSLQVDFVNPKDACQVCTCQMFGSMIVPVCRPSNEPGCSIGSGQKLFTNDIVYIEPKCSNRLPYESFIVDCQICTCQIAFQYVFSKCNPIPNCGSPYNPYIGSGSSANAIAIANAQSSGHGGLYDNYPYYPGDQSSAQAQAEAIANAQSTGFGGLYNNPYYPGDQSGAQAQVEAIANAQSSGFGGLYNNPYYPGDQSGAQAQAEAIANAQSSGFGGLYNNPYYPGDLSGSQAQAEAIANAQSSGLSGLYNNPYYPGDQSGSQAHAEAIANAQSSGLGGLYNNPYYPGGLSSAQAQAEAIANAQSSGLGGLYGGSDLSSAHAQAEAIANAQGGNLYPNNVNPYSLGNQGYYDALAQSMANAQTLGQSLSPGQGSTTAQSLAQSAAVSGRPLIRSGPGLCKYDGDKYHHNCQACYCFSELNGALYTLCLGNPCA